MTSMEMKSMTDTLESRFAALYEKIRIGEKKCFRLEDGRIISLGTVTSYGALVIEYADDYDEAAMNRFEDGDLFYLEDMSEDEMLRSMLQEISDSKQK